MKKYEMLAIWVDKLTCPELKQLKKIIKGVEIKRQERMESFEKKMENVKK